MTQIIQDGILLDDQTELSLNDLCRACRTSAEWVIELVEYGALDPVGVQQTQWRFSGSSLQRAHTAMRLQRDLDINTAGVALALELLDQIDSLHARLQQFEVEDDI